jgi:DNA-binding NtrC family response regulator
MDIVFYLPLHQLGLAFQAAQRDLEPVLITGSPGTGKRSVARWMHEYGPRSGSFFLEGSLEGSLSDQLLEAQGGTLLLHELGEYSLSMQKALLSFLKTKTVVRPGSDEVAVVANTRVIGTSSQCLESRSQAGLFNRELLECISFFHVQVPCLAEREDFESIVDAMIDEVAHELNRGHFEALKPKVWQCLKSYGWPGNLRELRSFLKEAIVKAESQCLDLSSFPQWDLIQIDLRATKEEFEKNYLLELLISLNWELDETCKVASMSKSTLLSKIQHYGIALDSVSFP